MISNKVLLLILILQIREMFRENEDFIKVMLHIYNYYIIL
jgi:hypothetical protein